jgi:hypothetical protein
MDAARPPVAFSFLSGPQQEPFRFNEKSGGDGSKELTHTAIFHQGTFSKGIRKK